MEYFVGVNGQSQWAGVFGEGAVTVGVSASSTYSAAKKLFVQKYKTIPPMLMLARILKWLVFLFFKPTCLTVERDKDAAVRQKEP